MTSPFQSVCRLCGADALAPAFTFDYDNAWVRCGDGDHGRGDEAGGCGLIQRAVTGHRSRKTPLTPVAWTEQYRLKDVVGSALEMMSTREGLALDVGCGAGHLASAYPRWITPIGVDVRLPETGKTDWGVGINTPFLDEVTQNSLRTVCKEDGFDIITAVGYLEGENDPRTFFAAAKSLLARDGILIVETPYAALALTRTLTSPFHAGANALYSLSALEKATRAAGLRTVRGSMTERAGGSIRLTFVHEDYTGHDYGPWMDRLAQLWDEEMSLSLGTRQAIHAFNERQRSRLRDVAALKAAMIRAGEHAYVLGTCPATYAMLTAVDFGYDVVSAHIGHEPRGGFPEVIDEKSAREAPPDILIAPSWCRRESLESWYNEIMNGMQLVFFEPELVVVTAENYAAELGRALAMTDGPGSVDTLRAALAAMRGPSLRIVSRTA